MTDTATKAQLTDLGEADKLLANMMSEAHELQKHIQVAQNSVEKAVTADDEFYELAQALGRLRILRAARVTDWKTQLSEIEDQIMNHIRGRDEEDNDE